MTNDQQTQDSDYSMSEQDENTMNSDEEEKISNEMNPIEINQLSNSKKNNSDDAYIFEFSCKNFS